MPKDGLAALQAKSAISANQQIPLVASRGYKAETAVAETLLLVTYFSSFLRFWKPFSPLTGSQSARECSAAEIFGTLLRSLSHNAPPPFDGANSYRQSLCDAALSILSPDLGSPVPPRPNLAFYHPPEPALLLCTTLHSPKLTVSLERRVLDLSKWRRLRRPSRLWTSREK